MAAANDYCAVPTSGDAWEGVYVSKDGGSSWTNSLLPGYPADTSTAGRQSPLFGKDAAAGDPLLDWDNANNLFVGGIAFNRTQTNPSGLVTPTSGDVFVSTYARDPSALLGIAYERTVVVGTGTPSAFFEGKFNDKPALKVDDWPSSPHENAVYISWTLFTGAGQDRILFSRSTDGGQSFSSPTVISKNVPNAQGSDIAVAPDGTVYVVSRQFGFPGSGASDRVVYVKSTDGGKTFSDPATVSPIVGYDRQDTRVSGGSVRDCGDGSSLATGTSSRAPIRGRRRRTASTSCSAAPRTRTARSAPTPARTRAG